MVCHEFLQLKFNFRWIIQFLTEKKLGSIMLNTKPKTRRKEVILTWNKMVNIEEGAYLKSEAADSLLALKINSMQSEKII